MSAWSRVHRIRPEAAGPRRALDAAVDQLARDGRSTPCADNPDAYVADDPDTRAGAARACSACPIHRQCHVYATAQAEPWGVWSGVDRSEVAP